MKIAATLLALAVAGGVFAQTPRRQPKGSIITFKGEVSLGQEFVRKVAPNLFFRLQPVGEGWEIWVVSDPKSDHDFTLVTLPVRFYRPVYLWPGYGLSPERIVSQAHRFAFVVNEADYPKAVELMNRLRWPSSYGDPNQAPRFKMGSGELKVLESRLGPDRIEWIAFEVRLSLRGLAFYR